MVGGLTSFCYYHSVRSGSSGCDSGLGLDLRLDLRLDSDRVGERGQLLSGGERQSVEIARVHNKYNVESIPVLHYYKRFVLHPLPVMCVHIFVRDIIHDAP